MAFMRSVSRNFFAKDSFSLSIYRFWIESSPSPFYAILQAFLSLFLLLNKNSKFCSVHRVNYTKLGILTPFRFFFVKIGDVLGEGGKGAVKI
jgi:hypothetical protein